MNNCRFANCNQLALSFFVTSNGIEGCGNHLCYCNYHANIMLNGWINAHIFYMSISEEIYILSENNDHSQCPKFLSDKQRLECLKKMDDDELRRIHKYGLPKFKEIWRSRLGRQKIEILTDFDGEKCRARILSYRENSGFPITKSDLLEKMWIKCIN